MKRFFSQLHRPLRNERGEITFFACFFVVGVVMLISFLLLYASVKITCINIRNGAKMELNNLSATIYADTYRSQRETNFEEYLRTLYSSRDYTEMLEDTEFNLYSITSHLYVWIKPVTRLHDYNIYIHFYKKP